jgi:hypothetical protein
VKKIEEKEMSWWDKLTNWWNSDSDSDKPGLDYFLEILKIIFI